MQRGGHGDGGMGAEPGVQLHHGSGGAQRHSSFHVSSDSVSCPDVHTRLFLPSLHRLSVRMIKYASRALHSMLRAQHVLYYTENEFYLGAVDKSSYKCMISFLAWRPARGRVGAPPRYNESGYRPQPLTQLPLRTPRVVTVSGDSLSR